ncbi:response regulator transcription factor [Streptomyces sp. PSKA54]|uniref:Response regulator transcription factor n=1 Tax=Streptomyces himalayensis subsp. aureolus TaxID=2758039 RepID=A0A7W2HK52_9ACTN|nr:response regulator transcription factor [Streptomyces himalayensis]MBA4866820.1 response regulator transcription factor [Streptomyces himalayensis subsp. aureolus]
MHILVAEPCAVTAERLVSAVRRQGYTVQTAQTGQETLRKYQAADLVLMNLSLPDIDGLEVCRSIRKAGGTPIICLSDQDNALDRVLALKSGADDCVTNSCEEREVLARIEAVMRRAQGYEATPEVISIRSLCIDGRAREVRLNNQVVDVTSKEFELLYTLATNPEAVVSRKELMEKIWHDKWAGTSRTIDTHVSSLRAKLGCPGWIITVRGVGYRIGHIWTPSRTASGPVP